MVYRRRRIVRRRKVSKGVRKAMKRRFKRKPAAYRRTMKTGRRKAVSPRTVVPRQMRTKGTYVFYAAGVSHPQNSASPYLIKTFHINTVYDPDMAITGSFNKVAPMYTYASQYYNHYRVERAVITVRFRQDGWTDGTTVPSLKVWGMVDDDGSSSMSTYAWPSMLGRPGARVSTINFTPDLRGRAKITIFWNRRTFIGQDPKGGASLVDARPGESSYLMLYSQWADISAQGTVSPAFSISVAMKQYTTWFEPRDLFDMVVNPQQMT